jgi:hypothetical protein
MGSNLLAVASTPLLPSIQHTHYSPTEEPSHGIGYATTSPWRLWLGLMLVAACRVSSRQETEPGQLEARWKGAADGGVSGTAVAVWCDVRRVLEIRMVQGDTGIALALYPGKQLSAGAYRVVDAAKAESLPPAAGVAVRWPTKTVIQGFQGDSGMVQLERSPSGRFSGRVSARARSVVDTQRIRLAGSFRELVVRPDTRGCPPVDSADEAAELEEDAEPADTGVD